MAGLLTLAVGLFIGSIAGYMLGWTLGRRVWIDVANGWRQLWEESMSNVRNLLSYQAAMITTLDRAQAIAEAFGPEDAFAFIIAELDDWPLYEEEETEPHGLV